MRVVEVSYGFTFNLPNYRSERIDLKAQIDPDRESATAAKLALQSQVFAMGGLVRESIEAQEASERDQATFDQRRSDRAKEMAGLVYRDPSEIPEPMTLTEYLALHRPAGGYTEQGEAAWIARYNAQHGAGLLPESEVQE